MPLEDYKKSQVQIAEAMSIAKSAQEKATRAQAEAEKFKLIAEAAALVAQTSDRALEAVRIVEERERVADQARQTLGEALKKHDEAQTLLIQAEERKSEVFQALMNARDALKKLEQGPLEPSSSTATVNEDTEATSSASVTDDQLDGTNPNALQSYPPDFNPRDLTEKDHNQDGSNEAKRRIQMYVLCKICGIRLHKGSVSKHMKRLHNRNRCY